jgi:hypothetical protein
MGATAFYLLVGALVVVTVVKLAQPLGMIGRQQGELSGLRREKARLSAGKAGLEAYQHGLATDRGVERAARREGYIRKGDRRLVFVPEKGKPSIQPAGKARKEASEAVPPD